MTETNPLLIPDRADLFFYYKDTLVAGLTVSDGGTPENLGEGLKEVLRGGDFELVNGIEPGMSNPAQFNGIGDLAVFVVVTLRIMLLQLGFPNIGGVSLTGHVPKQPEEYRTWSYLFRQVPGDAVVEGQVVPQNFVTESRLVFEVLYEGQPVYKGPLADVDFAAIAEAADKGALVPVRDPHQDQTDAVVHAMFAYLKPLEPTG